MTSNCCRPPLANALGDQGLVAAILSRQPWLVGFTCYLWNIERTLWIAGRLKAAAAGNQGALGRPGDHRRQPLGAAKSGGRLCGARRGRGDLRRAARPIRRPGVGRKPSPAYGNRGRPAPPPRASRWRTGRHLVALRGRHSRPGRRRGGCCLETARGCRFRCKYCYYPKSDDAPRFLSAEQIVANLRYAAEHGADGSGAAGSDAQPAARFHRFPRPAGRGNAARQAARSRPNCGRKGSTRPTARLLRQAGFHEVEIGLQSVEPRAWELMGRPTNLAAFERGVRAMLGEGIAVRVDLILGLPGDTADSIRRGIDFLHGRRLYSEVQVFNLSILPGTAFRQEAGQLGLTYQPWPPYYVLRTPTLGVEQMCRLMDEAQEAFGTEFDPLPPPRLDLQPGGDPAAAAASIWTPPTLRHFGLVLNRANIWSCGDLSPLSERPKEVASRFSGGVRCDATLVKTPESGDKSPHSKEIFACLGASVISLPAALLHALAPLGRVSPPPA